MLNIDNVVVTVGNIVVAGTLKIGGNPVSVTITLPPDLRLTLDELRELVGADAVDSAAAIAAMEANKTANQDLQAAENQA